MSNFGGHYDITIDDKTRVFIPARFRDEFNGKAIVCQPLIEMKCIYVYTRESWDNFIKRSELNFSGEALVNFRTVINSTMSELAVDKQGRLTLGQEFVDFADLTRDVTLVGAGTHLQIWDRNIWKKDLAIASKKFDKSLLSY